MSYSTLNFLWLASVSPQQLLKAEAHSWSLAELIHAVVLLTHYHSLASFTFGCGITPELHCDGGHTFRPPSLSQYCVCDIANGNGHAIHHDDLLGNQVSGQEGREAPVFPPDVGEKKPKSCKRVKLQDLQAFQSKSVRISGLKVDSKPFKVKASKS